MKKPADHETRTRAPDSIFKIGLVSSKGARPSVAENSAMSWMSRRDGRAAWSV